MLLEHPPLAVGNYTASGNSLLAVGMPCAFYSQQLRPCPKPNEDQLLSDEDVREKIYSNPLFDEEIIPMEIDQHCFNAESDLIESMPNHDSSVTISSKIDSFFDEFVGELTLLKSFSPGIDETDCHPEKEIRFAK
nr:hypothetical protein [Tanacetum cinerariifolium]